MKRRLLCQEFWIQRTAERGRLKTAIRCSRIANRLNALRNDCEASLRNFCFSTTTARSRVQGEPRPLVLALQVERGAGQPTPTVGLHRPLKFGLKVRAVRHQG